jgi:hypothetical protein
MIAMLAVLALPIGFLIRNRVAAFLVYAVVYAHLYTFQTALLVMQWTNGATDAFPASDSQDLGGNSVGYLAFTAVVGAVGFGLVALGNWLRARRRRAAGNEVRLDHQPG